MKSTTKQQQQASKTTVHSKIQPVVVKHVIKENPAAIPNLQESLKHGQSGHFPGKESVRFSEGSLSSPRFYGQGQPPYYGRPEEVSRDLLSNL